MKFKIELFGNKCNEYPKLTISHNQNIIYSDFVCEKVFFETDINLEEPNTIKIAGIDKSQGVNGKWDTMLDENGSIIADKWLSINNIWIDGISMGQEWIRSLTVSNTQEKFLGQTFWNNGFVSFSIQLPLLDWIIQEKFINSEEKSVASYDARSGERKFDYQFIEEKIKSIRQIIND